MYNPVDRAGDVPGKRYLLELTADGHPVTPTVDLPALLEADLYAVKPKEGADSVGLRFVPRREFAGLTRRWNWSTNGTVLYPRG